MLLKINIQSLTFFVLGPTVFSSSLHGVLPSWDCDPKEINVRFPIRQKLIEEDRKAEESGNVVRHTTQGSMINATGRCYNEGPFVLAIFVHIWWRDSGLHF